MKQRQDSCLQGSEVLPQTRSASSYKIRALASKRMRELGKSAEKKINNEIRKMLF